MPTCRRLLPQRFQPDLPVSTSIPLMHHFIFHHILLRISRPGAPPPAPAPVASQSNHPRSTSLPPYFHHASPQHVSLATHLPTSQSRTTHLPISSNNSRGSPPASTQYNPNNCASLSHPYNISNPHTTQYAPMHQETESIHDNNLAKHATKLKFVFSALMFGMASGRFMDADYVASS